MPGAADLIWPGFAMARATSSLTDDTGSTGFTTSSSGMRSHLAYGGEIERRIVCKLAAEKRRDRVRGIGEQHGVTIRRGSGRDFGADDRTRPGPVIDYDLLLQQRRELDGNDSRPTSVLPPTGTGTIRRVGRSE